MWIFLAGRRGLVLFPLGVYLMLLGNMSEKHHAPVAIVSLWKGLHIALLDLLTSAVNTSVLFNLFSH